MPTEPHVDVSNDGLRAIESAGGTVMGGYAMGGDFHRGPLIAISFLVGGASVNTVELGNTLGIEARFYDENGNLFTPIGTVEIRIENPKQDASTSVPVLDWTAMDLRGAQVYLYQQQFALTDLPGTWTVRVRGQMTSGKYLMKALRFLVAKVS